MLQDGFVTFFFREVNCSVYLKRSKLLGDKRTYIKILIQIKSCLAFVQKASFLSNLFQFERGYCASNFKIILANMFCKSATDIKYSNPHRKTSNNKTPYVS